MTYKDEVEELVEHYRIVSKLVEDATHRISGNPSSKYAEHLGLPIGKKKDSEHFLQYFGRMQDTIEKSYILQLIALFEKYIFTRIKQSMSTIENVVKKEHKKKSVAISFSEAAHLFVKDSDNIKTLRDVEILMKPYSPKSIKEDMSTLRNYRNYIAHGGRVGELASLAPEDVANILTDIVDRVCI